MTQAPFSVKGQAGPASAAAASGAPGGPAAAVHAETAGPSGLSGPPAAPAAASPGSKAALLRRLAGELRAAVISAAWLTFLALPLVVFRINSAFGKIDYLWGRLPKLAAVTFLATLAWRFLLRRTAFSRVKEAVSEAGGPPPEGARGPAGRSWLSLLDRAPAKKALFLALAAFLLSVPFWTSPYVVLILITALIYITLGLGLNIVVGVAGLLNLGYAAFFGVGAYTFGLLHSGLGLGFWACLPLGALSATVLGLLLGIPVLRLSGDYLAIVTLGFAEIFRLVLVNVDFTNGPRGIRNIPPPSLFGIDLNGAVKPFLAGKGLLHPDMDLNKVLIYFIILAIVALTVLCVYRLENSRLGRAWLALREDEVACQAMGINRTRAKLTAFALGSTWAGLAGVVFASQITFISPASFDFMLSVMVLSIVVLGGMGSIPGVMIGAAVLILLPEYLREFQDYRMLIFGLIMVLMMVFRPQGIIPGTRRVYLYSPSPGAGGGAAPSAGDGEGQGEGPAAPSPAGASSAPAAPAGPAAPS
ncbi:MAG: high-affinity branched-chain amino acid ABC transporter permease LivM [Deltaproteobacteria bacterium]|jgi:branched-chain amino acid transport system permease protein|nr:high-affinity branched-chain amino acid ABC transporter permease LivM [Deltaproteobacteria bacterium]